MWKRGPITDLRTYAVDDANQSSVVKDAREFLTIAREALDLWLSHHAFQHAGALAFYTLFSMAPLLIILTTIVGIVYGAEAASGEITAQIATVLGQRAAEAVTEAVRRSRTEEAGLLPTFLGIGALLFGATTLFAQMQSSLNQFWGVRSRPSRSSILEFLRSRLVSLSLVLILGFLLLVSFAATLAVSVMVEYANDRIPIPAVVVRGIDLATSLGIATLLFATIFKVLPDVHLRWSDMWRGAVVTALLFVVGQYLISLYLTSTAPASPYGAAGALVLILLWVYYSSLILYIGAAITRAWIRHRGDFIRPKATAVKVRIDILEEGELGQMERVNAVD
jgi:membrane protein